MSEKQATYEVATTRNDAMPLPIQSMAELATAGQLLAQSGVFGINNAAAGFVIMAVCQQEKMSLMEYLRTFHTVNNKPTMRADKMLAKYKQIGGKYKITENSTTRAAAVFEFDGHTYEWDYTIEDAKRTGDAFDGKGKLKDNYVKRPDDMLWNRLVSRSLRKIAPEIVAGIYTPEEMQDVAHQAQPAEPRRIDPSEVKSRVKHTHKTEPQTITIETDIIEESNYCPIGGEDYEGMAWANMPDDVLQMALESELDAITDAHRDAIRRELAARNEVI